MEKSWGEIWKRGGGCVIFADKCVGILIDNNAMRNQIKMAA